MAKTWKPDPTSWRTAPRPKGWKSQIIPEIKRRDGGRCTWIVGLENGGSWTMWADVRRCPNRGTDVDHMGEPHDHRIEMLRLLCEPHHDTDSSRRANAAKRLKAQQSRRTPPRHPGLIP